MDRSVLELAVGGVPYPHVAPDGEWRYRHAVRADGATALDHQAVADFLAYEATHGRTVSVIADPALADWERWPRPVVRPSPDSHAIQCCSHAYRDGCGSELVCHGTPIDAAARILSGGVLRSGSAASGRPASALAAESSWGEPADYFDHVMLANGRCTAPEAVARSRQVDRDLVPSDLERGYPTAVRFYFRWDALARRPNARFDGVHPIKVLGELPLDDELVAVVMSSRQLADTSDRVTPRFIDRIAALDMESPRPDEWASAANAIALTACEPR